MCYNCFGLICRGMLPILFTIASVGWSCPVANLTNEFWAVRTVETYVKSKWQRHNFNSPILDSNLTVLLLCPSPPPHPKLGLTNLIASLFTRNPNKYEQIADQLGIVRKAYHGKSFEGQHCTRLPSCSAFLKELAPRRIINWLNASKRFIVLWSAFSVKLRIWKWYKQIWESVNGSHANT